jgi:hypothetical protein
MYFSRESYELGITLIDRNYGGYGCSGHSRLWCFKLSIPLRKTSRDSQGIIRAFGGRAKKSNRFGYTIYYQSDRNCAEIVP